MQRVWRGHVARRWVMEEMGEDWALVGEARRRVERERKNKDAAEGGKMEAKDKGAGKTKKAARSLASGMDAAAEQQRGRGARCGRETPAGEESLEGLLQDLGL